MNRTRKKRQDFFLFCLHVWPVYLQSTSSGGWIYLFDAVLRYHFFSLSHSQTKNLFVTSNDPFSS